MMLGTSTPHNAMNGQKPYASRNAYSPVRTPNRNANKMLRHIAIRIAQPVARPLVKVNP